MITFLKQSPQGKLLKIDFEEGNEQQQVKDYHEAIWIEMENPTFSERTFVLQQANIDIPEHHELHQIEFSNQFYHESECIFLTVNLVTISYPKPESHAINIIVSPTKLLTVTYSSPNPINTFVDQLTIKPRAFQTQYELLNLLLRSFIGKNADILESVGERTNDLSLILSSGMLKRSLKKRENRLNETLIEVNLIEGIISMVYQSLSSVEMLINYLEESLKSTSIEWKIIKRDIFALLKQADYLNQKVVFQLDSTLGLINIEQMGIVKIFTVLAMVFMPPTLIASIYGMNFKHMPELNFVMGYPIVLLALILSAFFPWLIFRKKGWI